MAKHSPDQTATTHASSQPSAARDDDDFAIWGERLRRFALGSTAMLIAARPYWPSEDPKSIPSLWWTIALFVTFAVAMIGAIAAGIVRIRFSWTDAAVIGLALLTGLSASQGADRRAAINAAWNWGAIALVYALIRILPRNRNETAALGAVLLASSVAVATYGIYQVAVEYPEMRQHYQTHKPAVLQAIGIPPGSARQFLYEQRLNSNEPMSTFALTNSLAGFLVGPLVVALAIVGASLGKTHEHLSKNIASKWMSISIACLPLTALATCLLLTKSRSAYLGLAVALVVLAWKLSSRVPRKLLIVAGGLLLAGLLGLVVAGVATHQLDRQLITQSTKSLRFRWDYWSATWRLITESPRVFWQGVGPGNFGSHYLRHKIETSSEDIKDPHDMVLEVWATSGLPAAILLLTAVSLGIGTILARGNPNGDEPTAGEIEEANRQARSPRPRTASSIASLDPTEPPRSARWVLICGSLSWITVVIFGWFDPIGDASARWYLMGIAWCLAVVFGTPIWRRLGIPPAFGFGAGALALSINLLAAGGINMPAVAMMLWSLLAIGQNLRVDRGFGRERVWVGRGFAFIGGAVAAMLLGIFGGAVAPYLRSETATNRARDELAKRKPDFDRARNAYLAAIDLDSYNASPWVGLADLEFQYWLSRGAKASEPIWKEIDFALMKALDSPRNPRNLEVQERRAAYAREILVRDAADLSPIEIIKLRGQLVNALRNSTLAHPTNALFHAELAGASADLGEYAGAVREANEALRLDSVTSHLDRKLPTNLRKLLRARIPLWDEQAKSFQTQEMGTPKNDKKETSSQSKE